jgi:hypothetical protein
MELHAVMKKIPRLDVVEMTILFRDMTMMGQHSEMKRMFPLNSLVY